MKTIIAPTAPWPSPTKPRPPRMRIRRQRPFTYAKLQPISEVDYFREAREQIAEMKRKRAGK